MLTRLGVKAGIALLPVDGFPEVKVSVSSLESSSLESSKAGGGARGGAAGGALKPDIRWPARPEAEASLA